MTTEAVSRESTPAPKRSHRQAIAERQAALAAADGQVPETPTPAMAPRQILYLPLESIDVGPNVRLDVAGVDELAESIKTVGLLQPVKVRAAGDRWVLVWGQRRYLAAKAAGLERIPAITTSDERSPAETSIEQLVENLHRADLNPIDRAHAMRAVVDAGMSQADLARTLGLHPSTVANDLGILEAPKELRALIEQGALSPAHQRAMKSLAPKTQIELAKRAAREGLSAHGTEGLVQQYKRDEDWRKERDAQSTKAAKEAAEHLNAQLDGLAKKKVPLDADIWLVAGDANGLTPIAEKIKSRGYTNVTMGRRGTVESRSQAVGCDCAVWKIEVDYGRLTITPGCVSAKHQQAKTAADETKRRGKHALEESVHSKLRELGPRLVDVAIHGYEVDGRTARMLLWHALDYRLGNWSVAHGGKSGNPWPTLAALTNEQLAEELGKAIAEGFRDRYGYHVPWAELAGELGIEEPTPAAPKKVSPNEARQDRINAAAIADAQGLQA